MRNETQTPESEKAMKTVTVQTRDYGDVAVSLKDGKMVPIAGAATLADYRSDASLLPPWILQRDLAHGLDWAEIMEAMQEKN